jgi:hypothetical protein
MPERSTTKNNKMKENSEFRQFGKEVPYKTPAGFFESITENTLQKAILREQMHRKYNIRRVVFSVAASAAILLFLGYQWIIHPVDQSASNILSQDTQPARQTIIQKKPVPMNQIAALETLKVLKDQSPAKTLTEFTKAEGLSDVLAEMTDEELQQMAAMYQTDPFSEEAIQ